MGAGLERPPRPGGAAAAPRARRRAIALIGFMGAGKSTAAAHLSKATGAKAIDTDAAIERLLGHTIAEEIAGKGEASFREIEEHTVLGTLAGCGQDAIVSLGGGSVISERVQRALADWTVVLLDIDARSAWDRVQRAGRNAPARPLAGSFEQFADRYRERQPLYESLADAILPAGVWGVGSKALRGIRALQRAPAGTKMVWASAKSGEYPVLARRGLICDGALADAGGSAGSRWTLARRGRSFCVSDRTVAALYGERVGPTAAAVAIEPGETNKTLATAERVWSALAQAGMTRADHVLALGGGVVGDLAGFCAATYQRGVPVVHVPSTLVAQVDSAYGGKTGVDLPAAKNYVGAYHQPAGVIVDPQMLQSLPPRELQAGWVEVLKTALIAGGPLWERVCAAAPGLPPDDQTIIACLRTKLAIVAADERDAGERQLLNLGHTVGHAIESVTGYGAYLHGEAVGLGLLAALRVSELPQLRETVREMLAERGLPTSVPGGRVQVDAVMEAIGRDKKRLRAGQLPFVVVRAPGRVVLEDSVPHTTVAAAVAELIG